jgi:tetratricopeptide (TPR) repeat protein
MVSVCCLDAIDNRLARVVHLDGPPSENRFVAAAFSSDRKQVVFARSNKLCIQDVEDAKGTRAIDVDLFVPRGVTLTSNKAYVAAWDQESVITVRDCQSGDEVWKIDSNDQWVSVAFSPDCKSIALGSSKSFPSIWDLSKKTKTQILKANTNFSSSRVVVFSPDGKSLATNESGTIIVYDLESGTERCRFDGAAGSVTHLAFSSDGKRILAGGPYTVQLSDAGSGATISRCSVTGSEGGIDISPDGRRIVSAAGPMVSLWDADTGSEILSLNAESRIAAVGFSRDPDGKRIMAACIDGTIRIWDSANGDQMDDARDWHARGVVRLRNEETELAISAFTSAIETDPKNADSYRNRAFLYERRRETDKAIEDLQIAIQLGQEAPATSEAMLHLAVLYEQSNRSDDAEQQYQQILARLNKKPPNDVEIAFAAMSGLSCIHARQGHHDEAKKLYSTLLDSCSRTQDGDAWSWYTFDLPSTYRTLGDYKREKETRLTLLALLPQTNVPAEDLATAMNDMAWLCATCPEPNIRDGQLAVAHATKTCELTNRGDPFYVNTLAAAYAETGDFAAAVKSQQEAITLIDQGSTSAGGDRAGYEARLKLYQEGKPCREAPVKPAKGGIPKWTKAMR